jgi:hypothetical protein
MDEKKAGNLVAVAGLVSDFAGSPWSDYRL